MDWKDVARACPFTVLAVAWFVGACGCALLQYTGIFAKESAWVLLPMAVCMVGAVVFILWPGISAWLWDFAMDYRCLRHFVAKYITKEDLTEDE